MCSGTAAVRGVASARSSNNSCGQCRDHWSSGMARDPNQAAQMRAMLDSMRVGSADAPTQAAWPRMGIFDRHVQFHVGDTANSLQLDWSSFKDFMNNKNSRSLAEIRNYHLDEVKKSRSSNLVSKDLSKKANRSLSPKVHTSNRRSVERNSSRDFGPKRAKSQERRSRDGAPQRSRRCPKSPRIKSRSPRRRPRQHRSPKDTRGRIKSSKGRSRGRSMSPRPSRRLTRKSPVMSPMRDDHRPPPPPPPRDLFASSVTDEKIVVKEEIVDLACSDDEEVNCQRCRDDSHSPYCLNCKNVGHSTNECTRNREVCAYCRKTGHNIVSCPTVECKRCDQRGHIAMVCNSEERIQKPRFEQGQVLTCYNCDLNGHVMRNCPFKKTNEALKKKRAS